MTNKEKVKLAEIAVRIKSFIDGNDLTIEQERYVYSCIVWMLKNKEQKRLKNEKII